MPAFIDLTGQRFGRWLVIKRNGTHRFGGAQWLCRCDCGNERTIRGQALRTGDSRSCGCLNRDVHRELWTRLNTTHGHTGRTKGRSPTYRVWTNLKTRKHHKKYHGVTICDRWAKFENFLADMGERPSLKHTIDRIDNSKGYEPDNCRWATMKVQQNNRTNNRRITFDGRTQTLAQWAEETGFARKTISRRIDLGWTVERALTTEPRLGRNQYSPP